MELPELYADIILPLAIRSVYTYRVPNGYNISLGSRVTVPLGKNKYYTGIVFRIHRNAPSYDTKSIIVSDETHIYATKEQLTLWNWISGYYMCPLGLVYRAALPSSLKLSGNEQELTEKFAYKTTLRYSINPKIDIDEKSKELKKYKRQSEVFDLLVANGALERNKFERTQLPALAVLEKKGYIIAEEKKLDRTISKDSISKKMPLLTEMQSGSFEKIKKSFSENKPVLLHGVTGSGKTEIYINLIDRYLVQGRDVLYLLPEIAITSQLITRLADYFGERIIIYHSKINNTIRAEIYLRMLERNREPVIVVGVRSSVFLPFNNLGLIVVDEEHDANYKQNDTAPRYNARDSAVILAQIFKTNIILGSATPSIESYYNAVNNKYSLVELTEKYHGSNNIQYIISDVLRASKRGEKISHFTSELIREIQSTISEKNQAILFQNRRGYSPYIECQECGCTFFCSDCNVSMTYHKSHKSLVCHYCGKKESIPHRCTKCGSNNIKPMGFGTEKIEQELKSLFPEAAIDRFDLDTATNNKQFRKIISDMESGKTDILVGTQMVTKGFDFDKVTLSAILNADNMLNIPDFRAQERGFQTMMQVTGRAGRRNTEGTAVIQTSQPEHPVIVQVRNNDYQGMFRSQLMERHRFLYPPFCRLISFTLKNRNKTILDHGAEVFAKELRHVFGRRLLGPDIPAIDKIRNEYICEFLLKIEKEKSFSEAKKIITGLVDKINRTDTFKTLTVSINVDPQ